MSRRRWHVGTVVAFALVLSSACGDRTGDEAESRPGGVPSESSSRRATERPGVAAGGRAEVTPAPPAASAAGEPSETTTPPTTPPTTTITRPEVPPASTATSETTEMVESPERATPPETRSEVASAPVTTLPPATTTAPETSSPPAASPPPSTPSSTPPATTTPPEMVVATETTADPVTTVPSDESTVPPSKGADERSADEADDRAAVERSDGPTPTARPRRVLVIGDSSAAGIRWTAGAEQALQGAEFTLDLESCRRLVAPSCRGREGYQPATALEVLQWYSGEGHDTLVIAAGYNDVHHGFEDAFDQIVRTAAEQGVETILWTTYREDVGYQLPTGAATSYAAMNEMLRAWAASGEHPALHILDWWAYTADAAHWLARDGVHFTDAGSYGFADLISRTIAALDGRPCPVPWSPGEPPDDPCPVPYGLPHERGGVPPVIELHL